MNWAAHAIGMGVILAAAVPGVAAEPPADGAAAVTTVTPDGGRVVQEGSRIDLYDARSNRVGYGQVRPDGSVDVFNMDGSRRATITPGTAGGPARVTLPRGRR